MNKYLLIMIFQILLYNLKHQKTFKKKLISN